MRPARGAVGTVPGARPPRRAWRGSRRSFVPRAWPASPVLPAAALGAGALCLCALPPAILPPALCFAALGSLWEPLRAPHPVCTSTPPAVPPPVPLCCIPLFSSWVTCHSPGTRLLPFSFFHCLSRVYPLSPFSLWSSPPPPPRLCLPYVVSHSLSIPFPSRHCLIYPLPTVSVC